MEIKHREMAPSVHPDAYVASTAVPIGWVAVGDPARLYPPDDAASIRARREHRDDE